MYVDSHCMGKIFNKAENW